MMTITHFVVSSTLISLMSLGPRPALGQGREEHQERQIEWSALPEAVQKTVKSFAVRGKLGQITVEEEEDGLIYEVEVILDGGRIRTLSVDPDGALIEMEEQVEWRSLPRAVQAGLERLAGGGEIVEIEMVTRGKTNSVLFDPAGDFLMKPPRWVVEDE